MFFLMLRVIEYLVVCTACMVYVKAGPGGEFVGNVLDVVVDQFLKVDWQLIATTIRENAVAMLAEGESHGQ